MVRYQLGHKYLFKDKIILKEFEIEPQTESQVFSKQVIDRVNPCFLIPVVGFLGGRRRQDRPRTVHLV